jgi:hypothetical protein
LQDAVQKYRQLEPPCGVVGSGMELVETFPNGCPMSIDCCCLKRPSARLAPAVKPREFQLDGSRNRQKIPWGNTLNILLHQAHNGIVQLREPWFMAQLLFRHSSKLFLFPRRMLPQPHIRTTVMIHARLCIYFESGNLLYA